MNDKIKTYINNLILLLEQDYNNYDKIEVTLEYIKKEINNINIVK